MASLFESIKNLINRNKSDAADPANKSQRIRVKGRPSSNSRIPIAHDRDSLGNFIEELDGSSLLNLSEIDRFRTLATDRETMYRMYDEMSLDSTIATALQMYSDDATQYNTAGQVIWAESPDKDVSEFANRLIRVLGINENAWSHIFSMTKYGDLYLELFYDDEPDSVNVTQQAARSELGVNIEKTKKGAYLQEYIEQKPNPAEMFDIQDKGKTVGYINVPCSEQESPTARYAYQQLEMGTETDILPPTKFIHISLSEGVDRFPERLVITFNKEKQTADYTITSQLPSVNYNDGSDDVYKKVYTVSKGQSILHDIYKIFRELEIMEDALLLNRATRSSIIRILQVEMGDGPKNQAREKLKRLKNIIEQKNYMDKNDGTFSSQASPSPIDNIIYVPTHNGDGAITSTNIGGDVDVRSIVDLDYFRQKLAGALKIPMAYLYGTCIRGSVKINLLDGTSPTIKEMYENKSKYIGKGILSCTENGSPVPSRILNIMQTRKDAKYVRITVDNGQYVDLTPDHRVMLRDGSFCEAQYLTDGTSLMPYYEKIVDGRTYIKNNHTGEYVPLYKLVGEKKYKDTHNGENIPAGYQCHHIDENKLNDDPSNICFLTKGNHLRTHTRDRVILHKGVEERRIPKDKIEDIENLLNDGWEEGFSESHLEQNPTRGKFGKDNPNYGSTRSDECKRKIGEANSKRVWKDESRKKISEFASTRTAEKNPFFGKKHSQESIQKMKDNMPDFSGANNPCYGKKMMNNGEVQLFVSSDKFDEYLANGYQFGKIKVDKSEVISNSSSSNTSNTSASVNAPTTTTTTTLVSKDDPEYNHKVVSVEWLDVVEDAYDLTVDSETHAFPVEKLFNIHNCFENGLGGGASLTKMDSRYARSVKRIQNAYINGITTLINVFAIHRGLENHVNNFTIKMVSPSTMEEIEHDEILKDRIDMVSSFMNLIDDESITADTRKEILTYFFNDSLNLPDVTEIINRDDVSDYLTKTKLAELKTTLEETIQSDEPEDFGSGEDSDFGSDESEDSFSSSSSSSRFSSNDEFGSFDTGNEESSLGNETSTEPSETISSVNIPDTDIVRGSTSSETTSSESSDNGGFGDFTSEY